MDHLIAALDVEIAREKKLATLCEEFLASAPKGFLTVRQRACGLSYYWTFADSQSSDFEKKQKQINITNNPDLILKLTEKKIKTRTLKEVNKNLPSLEQARNVYHPVHSSKIVKECPPKYQDVLSLRKTRQLEARLAAPYEKCPYDPDLHVHETDYGELVRSKSEQLLGNTLFSYGIPFHYEEAFKCFGNIVLYPDFRILLPNGEWKLWEHWGLLSKKKYCDDCARKLNLFQQSGLTIGNNLILTMDDNKGDFSSRIINQTIVDQILPLLQGVKVDRNKIIAGIRQPYLK